ncbi:Pyrimidodiazepine synthase [Amphibalanus amphitrite]|uniref:Pyrimidodiazepine synthase n=1 Tax=Amphibalanus amphitrite TaxID=1232801 RepID=A0A6A4WYU6_AMPAM|nr:Pyrimidodiazepine synthase [Amphibalanus amphitrite]
MGVISETKKHLTTGSECPPLKPGTLRCYSMKFCPYAQRTRLVLAAKGVPHEIVNINLKAKPEWYLAKSATGGKVPGLELDDHFATESLITCDLLEELYPQPALYPTDPWLKARDRLMVELFGSVSSLTYQMYRAMGDAQKIKQISEDFNTKLQIFEKELVERGTPFFFGDRPGMLDLMIWPWVERFPAARKLGVTSLPTGEMPPPPPEIKHFHEWVMRMTQHPEVKSCSVTTEDHMKFIKSFIAGNPDYDMEISSV